ncbi:MAG TPA: ABC transporter permease [Polyangiales bacterium]|jgi:ABC-2 type transport system permease protein|nr:ABC transporter permease [Polyangiales bacterium]
MDGALAMIEREFRKFRRSPALIMMSLMLPIVQLVILGYAFGGVVKHLRVGVVDQDHGVPALQLRELMNAVAANAQTFETQSFADMGQAVTALRNGAINGVLAIPPDFSRRALSKREPSIALIEDNADSFVAGALAGTVSGLTQSFQASSAKPRTGTPRVDLVEIYPYIPYIQYLLPGSIVMSIFMMVMIGGGIIYIDDKARGLHEGYLVTPITRLELILGFTVSGATKAVISGVVLMTLGSLIAGIADPFEPMRLLRLFVVIVITAVALMSMMFLIMVRMNDPLMPRAMFGVLNTLLYFPSGAVYPQQAFPDWMRAIAAVDPFTYAVHALKCLLLKNTGFTAILPDLMFLSIFSLIAMTGATLLFRRSL